MQTWFREVKERPFLFEVSSNEAPIFLLIQGPCHMLFDMIVSKLDYGLINTPHGYGTWRKEAQGLIVELEHVRHSVARDFQES